MRRISLCSLPILLALLVVPAGPAFALVSCEDTIVVDTTLTLADPVTLAPCPGDGIIIGADNVTLDLGGRTIRGSGLGAGVRIGAAGDGTAFDIATIKNGKIIGFRTASPRPT